MTNNPFKQALIERRRQAGVWTSLGSPLAAQILAGAGFDWILIDTEHAPVDPPQLVPLLQATVTGTAEPIVRPAWNDAVIIKRILDTGVRTLLVPFVQNAEEARAAVSASRYPPDGIRGVASLSRASSFGRHKGYHAGANADMCILAQVETPSAVDNIAEIGAVDGIDGIFVGPSDLAASMGHLGNPGHPDVQARIGQALAMIQETGKAAGVLAGSAAAAEHYFGLGFTFVSAGSDISILAAGADATAAELAGSGT